MDSLPGHATALKYVKCVRSSKSKSRLGAVDQTTADKG